MRSVFERIQGGLVSLPSASGVIHAVAVGLQLALNTTHRLLDAVSSPGDSGFLRGTAAARENSSLPLLEGGDEDAVALLDGRRALAELSSPTVDAEGAGFSRALHALFWLALLAFAVVLAKRAVMLYAVVAARPVPPGRSKLVEAARASLAGMGRDGTGGVTLLENAMGVGRAGVVGLGLTQEHVDAGINGYQSFWNWEARPDHPPVTWLGYFRWWYWGAPCVSGDKPVVLVDTLSLLGGLGLRTAPLVAIVPSVNRVAHTTHERGADSDDESGDEEAGLDVDESPLSKWRFTAENKLQVLRGGRNDLYDEPMEPLPEKLAVRGWWRTMLYHVTLLTEMDGGPLQQYLLEPAGSVPFGMLPPGYHYAKRAKVVFRQRFASRVMAAVSNFAQSALGRAVPAEKVLTVHACIALEPSERRVKAASLPRGPVTLINFAAEGSYKSFDLSEDKVAAAAVRWTMQTLSKDMETATALATINTQLRLGRQAQQMLPLLAALVNISEAMVELKVSGAHASAVAPYPVQSYGAVLTTETEHLVPKPRGRDFATPLLNGTVNFGDDEDSQYRALAIRLADVKSGVEAEYGLRNAPLAGYVAEFASVFSPDEPLVPATFEEVQAGMMRPAQREGRSMVRMLMNVLSFAGAAEILAFLKGEVARSIGKAARLVSTVLPDHHLSFGRYGKALNRHMKTLPFYAFKGGVPQQEEDVGALARNNLFLFSADVSKMDASVPGFWAAAALSVATAWFGEHATSGDLAIMFMAHIGARMTLGRWVTEVGFGTNSGRTDTTWRNTLIIALFNYCARRMAGCSPLEAAKRIGLVGGDDSISGVDGLEDKFVASHSALCVSTGFAMEVEIRPSVEPASFLGRVWLAPALSNRSGPDIERVLAKFSSLYPGMRTVGQAAVDRAAAFDENDGDIPVLGDLHRAVIRGYPYLLARPGDTGNSWTDERYLADREDRDARDPPFPAETWMAHWGQSCCVSLDALLDLRAYVREHAVDEHTQLPRMDNPFPEPRGLVLQRGYLHEYSKPLVRVQLPRSTVESAELACAAVASYALAIASRPGLSEKDRAQLQAWCQYHQGYGRVRPTRGEPSARQDGALSGLTAATGVRHRQGDVPATWSAFGGEKQQVFTREERDARDADPRLRDVRIRLLIQPSAGQPDKTRMAQLGSFLGVVPLEAVPPVSASYRDVYVSAGGAAVPGVPVLTARNAPELRAAIRNLGWTRQTRMLLEVAAGEVAPYIFPGADGGLVFSTTLQRPAWTASQLAAAAANPARVLALAGDQLVAAHNLMAMWGVGRPVQELAPEQPRAASLVPFLRGAAGETGQVSDGTIAAVARSGASAKRHVDAPMEASEFAEQAERDVGEIARAQAEPLPGGPPATIQRDGGGYAAWLTGKQVDALVADAVSPRVVVELARAHIGGYRGAYRQQALQLIDAARRVVLGSAAAAGVEAAAEEYAKLAVATAAQAAEAQRVIDAAEAFAQAAPPLGLAPSSAAPRADLAPVVEAPPPRQPAASAHKALNRRGGAGPVWTAKQPPDGAARVAAGPVPGPGVPFVRAAPSVTIALSAADSNAAAQRAAHQARVAVAAAAAVSRSAAPSSGRGRGARAGRREVNQGGRSSHVNRS